MQHLARYPNSLGARLFLAAAYSESGQEAAARAEIAEVERISPQLSLEGVKQGGTIRD